MEIGKKFHMYDDWEAEQKKLVFEASLDYIPGF
jgi:hypothetical protein